MGSYIRALPAPPFMHGAAQWSSFMILHQGGSIILPSNTRVLDADDEANLVLEGICAFADPPKATCTGAIARLAAAGIRVKILSGDDPVLRIAYRDRKSVV